MGMFDSYEPNTDLHCPNCGTKLSGWQGKDGPNELLLWRQGQAKPVGFLCVDDEGPIEFDNAIDDESKLPDTFKLHTICDNCDSFVKAVGTCRNGIWNSTTLVGTDK